MRSLLKKILQGILRFLAVLTIKKFKPGIVGVTGSVGKTSTKEAIFAVLRSHRRVRVSKSSLNNEFGFPLTILGDWSDDDLRLVDKEQPPGGNEGKKVLFWLKVVFFGVLQLLLYARQTYPEVLILEYGADRPGDLQYLLRIAKPHIGVVTAVGDVPVHVEFFEGPEGVLQEKSRLIESLPGTGVAILNGDEPRVVGIRDKTKAHAFFYGFAPTAHVKISNIEYRIEKKKPVGISFQLEHSGGFVSVRLDGVLGKAQAYSAAAAAAVGLTFGVKLTKVAEALAYLEPPPHRLRILSGSKQTVIIDDSYNASPASMRMALETINELKAKRKIGVLGDMLEIGKYTVTAHEEIGKLAGKTVNVLVTVGGRAKFIAKAAHKAGLAKKNIFSFDTREEVVPFVKKMIKSGDLVLVKASRGIGLEKLTEAIEIRSRLKRAR